MRFEHFRPAGFPLKANVRVKGSDAEQSCQLLSYGAGGPTFCYSCPSLEVGADVEWRMRLCWEVCVLAHAAEPQQQKCNKRRPTQSHEPVCSSLYAGVRRRRRGKTKAQNYAIVLSPLTITVGAADNTLVAICDWL